MLEWKLKIDKNISADIVPLYGDAKSSSTCADRHVGQAANRAKESEGEASGSGLVESETADGIRVSSKLAESSKTHALLARIFPQAIDLLIGSCFIIFFTHQDV
ncbi:hypothetical protein [Bacillus sp. FJAT-28004]|uniref:hypothetical protein n=1 Tax=Bacillus sp. FJAT-28004 TaxID=1679165 RepID=UPI0006B52B4B|nr:hypothetical protein [Bacillus sp. FJAT-28004]